MADDDSGARPTGKNPQASGTPDDPKYVDPQGRRVMPRHRRQALRQAKRQGLNPRSGDHALYLLADEGIDVIGADESMLSQASKAEKDTADGGSSDDGQAAQGRAEGGQADADSRNLPARRAQESGEVALTDQEFMAPDKARKTRDFQTEQEEQVHRIQRELVGRRRRRFLAMMLRLAVFVFLPTAAVGYYYFVIATPMYETKSEFVIQTSESPTGGGGGLSLLSGTSFATVQDSIVVQGYLTSREALIRLNEDHGYIDHFQNPRIDLLQRLPQDATMDDAYALYQQNVTVGYDPTEGILRMSVVAATPEASQTFAEALIGYAEERVDGLTEAARGDQLQVAMQNYRDAQNEVDKAAERVLQLQQQRGVLSADVELESQMQIINNLALELERKRLELAELQSNANPNDARVDILKREIANLDKTIKERRSELTANNDDNTSLARVSGELSMAQSQLEMRNMMLSSAISALDAARLEASRQVRYLSMGVAPVAPDEATYPREIENTILAFLIFGGIYIMVSLTINILREQVSV